MKYFLLLRKRKFDKEWKSTTQGTIDYVLSTLRLHLDSPELQEFEWKIEPIKTTL